MAEIDDYVNQEDWDEVPEGNKTPEGEYRFKIDKCTIEENKNGKGTHFLFELTITGPVFAGSKEWHRITKDHEESDQAVNIGKKQFKQMYLACGMDKPPTQTEAFVDKYIQGDVLHDGEYTRFKNPKPDEGEPDGPKDQGSSGGGEGGSADDDIPF